MAANSNATSLPNGYKTIDRTKLKGKMDNLSPVDAALRSLLVRDKDMRNERDITEKSKPPVSKVSSIANIISNNIQGNNDLRTITHYIKRAEQIWTALLLKPNGDQRQLFIYDTDSSDIKNSKLHEILLQKVENYFTTKYPIETMAPQIIKDVLFRTGSYVHLNMSHAVLDHLINGMEVEGNESFVYTTNKVLSDNFVESNWKVAKNIGYIRKDKESINNVGGLEGLYGGSRSEDPEYNLVHSDLGWTFTDNPVVLKVTELVQKVREDRLSKRAGLENINSAISNVFKKQKGKRHKTNNNHVGIMSKKNLDQELKELYPERNYQTHESLSVRKGQFYSGNGRGLGVTFHWPSESCIPVHINGNVGKPFGYILLTDPESGDPLKTTSDVKYYQKTSGSGITNMNNGPGSNSINDVIANIKRVAQGGECEQDMSWMVEFASATLEKELAQGFFNGDLKKNVSISLTEENKKIYMSRALRDQGVRAIFVPSEYITYVAVDFNRLGVGRSLVDEARLHITRLAVLDTANALAQVENSISHTLLEITPEEEDVDVRNTVSLIRDEWFAGNPGLSDILGYNNVSIDSILDRFKEQSVTVKVNGSNNPHVVAPDINTSQMEREPLKSIDPESRESLLNTISGFFGLKRSWLEDTGEGNDFAIEALADQELLRNQTVEYSRTFSLAFTDMMRKHICVNEPMIGELIEAIRENKSLYTKSDQEGKIELEEEKVEDTPTEEPDKKVKGKKKVKEEIPVEKEEEEIDENEELEMIELVLKDFLDTFYVVLPTPAITESLTKLEDKMEAVEKLVEMWVSLGGGVKMLSRRATEVGLNGDDIVENMKAILLNEAFERYNLPMPFEAILNNGKSGGMMTFINKAVDLDGNMVHFLTDWAKQIKKNEKKVEALKKKIEGANQEESDMEFDQQQGDQTGLNNQIPIEEEVITDTDGNTETKDFSEDGVTPDEVNDDTAPKDGDDIWGNT